jgi:RNA polymerase sigma-70 factor (ECF subfamily)
VSVQQAVVTATRDEVSRDFGAFYAQQWSAIAGYCGALMRDQSLGDELAQEAFVRLYPRWHVVRDPRAYAFRIATNLARRHVRDLTRGELRDDAAGATPPPSPDPEVADAIDRLPHNLRRVVWLRYYADLPIATIAVALRRPEGTVKRQLHDAHRRLARALGDDHA